MRAPVGTFLALAWLVAAQLALGATPTPAEVDYFEKKVRPILVSHCYECHSTQAKQKGGLLLDSRAGVLKGGDSGPVLKPSDPDGSLLIKAIRYQSQLRMPPQGKLPPEAIAILETWVKRGAPDPREGKALTAGHGINLEAARSFWSFTPPRKHLPPPVRGQGWARSDIDRFILARLEARGLEPVADADRVTLIRRLSFALTGLPPAPEEIEAFVADPAPDALAKVVDRLLESPHFGERWGRHWLDVARYAESTGGGRSMLLPNAWRYRDYVIRAFNEDRPYNRFILEQIAGDLLPTKSDAERADALIATAFLALGPTNYERQDKDILEMDVIDEQLDTLGRAFLGQTIGCARCHDHKFDPIPTADYYAMAGILHSTQTLVHSNVSSWVELPLPMEPELAEAVRKHEEKVAAMKKEVDQLKKELTRAGKAIPTGGKGLAVASLPGIVLDDTQARRVGAWTASTSSNTYIGSGYLHDGASGKGEKSLTFIPEVSQAGRYEVRLAYTASTNRAARVPVTVVSADGTKVVHVNQQSAPPIGGHFVSLGVYTFAAGTQGQVKVANEGTTGHVIADAVQLLPESMVAAAPRPGKPAPMPESSDVARLKKMEADLKKLEASGPTRPLAMGVREGSKPHDVAICIRGSFHNQGEKVSRGFLRVLSPNNAPAIPAGQSGRLQLAQWLASPDNPLTARVMVNRIWHHLFGQGIVRTVDNLGRTGELPSHPELLDTLANDFVEQGWSVKKLIRGIVLSRVYGLSCEADARGLAADPENRLLGRMNRRRLEAEAIRDTILVVSGQLDRSVGGPTIRKGTGIEYGYTFNDVRRSVYTPVFRNRLLELHEVFDFADPNLVVGRRNVSTVAPQALYMMNNPFVMEQARLAAQQALAWEGMDDETRLTRAFQLALGRAPSAAERQMIQGYLAGAPEKAPLAERLAAWEKLYQVLFACIDFRYVS